MKAILTDEEVTAASNKAFHIVQGMPDNDVNGETWDKVFARAIEVAIMEKIGEPVGYFEQEYVGGPVLFYQVNYSQKDEPGVTPLYAIKKEGA